MNSRGNINFINTKLSLVSVNSQKASSEPPHKVLDCIILLTPTFKEDAYTIYYQYTQRVLE